MNNNRINIIKHIEEKEGKDIFQDYNIIKIMLDGQKYSHKPLYVFVKNQDTYEENAGFYEEICEKDIQTKSQIANRIQYIKQSGYIFKEYFVSENSLTIVFE